MENYINKNQISKEINNSYFNSRDMMLTDKKFDINNFLNNTKTKYIFNSFGNKRRNNENNLFKHSSYINKSKILNHTQKNSSKKLNNGLNLSSTSKKNLELNLPSISMNSCKSSFSNIYKPKEKYLGEMTNYNISKFKSTNVTPRINNRYSNYKTIQEKEEDLNYFNVIKTIKYIKSKEKNFDFKSYLNKTKDITQRKNALIALNSDKVLNNYYKSFKAKESEDIPISIFLTQRKEVSINNLLIKLMNSESNKLQKQEQKLTKELQKDMSDINNEELKLNEYTNNQKIECKKIETTLANLITKHENLIKEEQSLLLDVKIKEFEIYKLLIDINLYRYFAKFSNTVLDGDPSKFNKQILPDYHDFDKIDLEPIIEEVLTNYSNIKVYDKLLKPRKTNRLSISNNSKKEQKNEQKHEIKYKEEGYFLYNPEFLYHKYNEIEGNILRLLTKKEKLIIKKLKREKQNNEAFSYLIDRCNDLKIEYDNICSLYNREKTKYESDLVERTGSHDISLNETKYLITDLFSYIVEVFENTVSTLAKMNNNNYQHYIFDDNNFDDLVKHGKFVMRNLENNLNIILKEIRDERKDDRKTFEKVIKDIKIFYKMERQNLFEKNLLNENKMKRLKMLQKQNNIKIIPRRDEPPYFKGRPKKVEIDYDAIKKEEDKELIYYH